MPENKGHSADQVRAAKGSEDALGLRDVLTISGGTDDPCNITSNLQFRYDSASGNTLIEVQSPDDPRMLTQQIVLPGVDLTSFGSLSDSQVMQLLLSHSKSPADT